MKKFFFILVSILMLKSISAEQPWFYYYRLGIENYNNNQYQLAITALDKSIELNPSSSSHARTYGMNFIEYYPYFYKALCLSALQMPIESKNVLEIEFRQGEIQKSKEFYNKALILKDKINYEIKKSNRSTIEPFPKDGTVTENENNVSQGTDQINNNSNANIIDNKSSENRKNDRQNLIAETKVLREAISNYFNGEYNLTINKLSSLPDDLPPRIKYLKNFFLGCSFASIYYLEGEKNKETLNTAISYFSRVGALPPRFRNNMPKFISPKIISLFMQTR